MIDSFNEAFIAPFQTELVAQVLGIAWLTAPLWAPPVLILMFFRLWLVYIHYTDVQSPLRKTVLLEIKLPQEILKTPLAMEIVLSALYVTSGETTVLDRKWAGKHRTWFSLELASIEGNVHFFIWTREFFRNMVEAAMYSQYPEVEIHEVPDYSLYWDYIEQKNNVWGVEYKLTKPDPYPIKTYIDYGLDKPTDKPELNADPMAPLIEFLGSAKKGDQLWLQIIIRSHKSEIRQKGAWFGWTDWRVEAKKIVDDIMHRDPKTKSAIARSPGEFAFGPMLTDEEKKAAESIMRSINKQAFDVGIRALYISDNATFNAIYILGLIGCMRQFSSMELNGLQPCRGHYVFGWPWQMEKLRTPWITRRLLRYYRQRAWFHPPYTQKSMVMTTEELATLWHLPSATVAATPTFGRIMSKKAQPPVNLPV
jgi:hypothetical protein